MRNKTSMLTLSLYNTVLEVLPTQTGKKKQKVSKQKRRRELSLFIPEVIVYIKMLKIPLAPQKPTRTNE